MIIRNAIQCLRCLDIIESKHTHDYVTCKCYLVSVDGGHNYLRRTWQSNEAIDVIPPYRELSELSEEGE